jgi:hypothetical protein
MLQRFRLVMSILLMILGVAMFLRGLENSLKRGLGWQGTMMSCVLGGLVFALGFARWRYLRQKW